jgi:hypothetical protein
MDAVGLPAAGVDAEATSAPRGGQMIVDAPASMPEVRKWRGAARLAVLLGGGIAAWAAVGGLAVLALRRAHG